MPKDFSEDGAFGATSAPAGSPGGFGAGGGNTDSQYNTGGTASDNFAQRQNAAKPAMTTQKFAQPGGSQTYYNNAPTFGNASDLDAWETQQGQPTSTSQGFSFAEGGAIPDDDGDSDYNSGNGSPEQDRVSKALETVDGVLAFGRKLHGLGGDDDGGAIQTADAGYTNGRMPAVPGSQSNSGVPPLQPQPGPLPPTNNPFGKRQADAGNTQVADAGYTNGRMPAIPGNQSDSGVKPIQPAPGPLPPTANPFGKRADNDEDDQGGAINTDEDTA